MMLERLRIKDFQCHGDLGIEFGPKVTTLTGASDIGKSAVLRAIRWAMTNRPLGDAHVRNGAEGVVVKLLVDGRTVRRRRGKGVNAYELDRKRYEAFGGDVPEEIGNLLGVGDMNFQGQHDPSFWFGLSPPEVARQLNRVVDLDVMDAVTACVAACVRSVGVELDVVGRRLDGAQGELGGLSHVPGADKALKALEGLAEEGVVASVGRDALLAAVGDADRASRRAGETAVPDTSRLDALAEALEGAESRCRLLGIKVDGVAEKESALGDRYNSLVEVEGKMRSEVGDRCPLCGSEWKG